MRCLTEHLYFEGVVSPPRARRPSLRAREAHHPPVQPEAVALDAFMTWLLERAGLDPTRYRARCFMRRLAACLRQLHAPTPALARKRLEAHPEMLTVAVDSVLLGVTQFFRDPGVFAAIRDLVLPSLLRDRERLRIWSAACSDGPELYSVAMLLADLDRLAGCELLGTDCRRSAIERAVTGLYAQEALATVDPERRHHFIPAPPLARVVPELCSATRWEVQDLFRGPAPGPWDLILWRNMAIYLDAKAAEPLWHAFAEVLRPGGFFVTGKADHPPQGLGWSRLAPCVYRKPGVA